MEGHSPFESNMRDPVRIDPFLMKLSELWKKYPDLRFYQLVVIIGETKDMFYVEEPEILKRIEELLKENP